MESKLEISKKLFEFIVNGLECPICKTSINKDGNSLKCENSHTFNLSKKGTVVLQSKAKIYDSDLYTKELFINRRFVIGCDLYKKIYEQIINEIKEFIKPNSIILDLGSGEGSHLNKLKTKLGLNTIGVAVDISKPAIELASDYLSNGIIPIIADTNNLPFKKNTIDIVLDFLSPLMVKETMRVVKPGGIIVKVIPNNGYLKEIRKLINEKDYEKTSEILNNIKTKVDVEKVFAIQDVISIDSEIKKALLKMTPLTNKKNLEDINIADLNSITIDLSIVIIRKGKNEI